MTGYTARQESAFRTQAASHSERSESPNVSIRQECFLTLVDIALQVSEKGHFG